MGKCGPVVLVLVLGGCAAPVLAPDLSTPTADVATYGVPIVCPGMTKAQVDRCTSESGGFVVNGQFSSITAFYSSGLCVHFVNDRATEAWVGPFSVEGAPNGPPDPRPVEALRNGMTPRQVEAALGPAACGYEDAGGRVVLIYSDHEISVAFANSVLKDWRRTHRHVGRETP